MYDHQSPAYRFYKEKIQEYRGAPSHTSSLTTKELQPQVCSPAKNPPSVSQNQDPPVKRKRKSRWGSEDDKVQLPVPAIVIPEDVGFPQPNIPSLSGIETNIQCLSD